MLDNMDVETIKKAVKIAKGKVLIEASGGVNLDNIREIALTCVDFISIGALTHSAKAVDISMKIREVLWVLVIRKQELILMRQKNL